MTSKLISCGAAIGAACFQSIGLAYAQSPDNAVAPAAMLAAANADPSASVPAASDTVFAWQEVPANQQVPITRAVFDRGGYELYDTVGETITVPFTNNNLFVMKFAHSTTGDMYFVNDGTAPVLYVPDGGYLENASVPNDSGSAPGAKWYPFTADSQSTDPQYMGIAPDYSDYEDMGWYPDMVCWGGYYCATPYLDGGVFLPEDGLTFIIGGYPVYGWRGYLGYCSIHPAPFRCGSVFGFDYRFGFEHRFDHGRVFGGALRRGGNGDRFGVVRGGHSGLIGSVEPRRFRGIPGGGASGEYRSRPGMVGGYAHGEVGGGSVRTFRGAFGAYAGGAVRTTRVAPYGSEGMGGYSASPRADVNRYVARPFAGSSFATPGWGAGRSFGAGQSFAPRSFGGGPSYTPRSFGGGQSFASRPAGGGQSFAPRSVGGGNTGGGRR